MPTVPRRSTGYVPTQPLPSERVPSGAFQSAPPIDITPAVRGLSEYAAQEKKRQDQVALLDADNQLGALELVLHQQATQLRGKDAYGAQQLVRDTWSKRSDEIRQNLSNDDQRLSFEGRASARYQSLLSSVAQHTETESKRYDAETTDAGLKLSLKSALDHYTDAAVVERSLADSKKIIDLFADHNGWSREERQQKQLEQTSQIHAGVIDMLLQDDKDIDATKYFQAHANELDPKALLQARDSLDVGSLRGEATRRSDSIVQSTATLGGALAEAAKITDPKLREATEGRIRRKYEDRAADERFQREEAYQQASDIVEQTRDLHRIPPALWLKLSPEEHNQLEHRLAQKRNPERSTDMNTYTSLLNMAGLSDSTRAEFEKLDLMKYRSQLDDGDYKYLLHLQLGERRQTEGALSGEAKRQAAVAERDARKDAQRAAAAETLRSLGIDVPIKAPGGPLRTQSTPLRVSPKGKQVPQTWIDRASKDVNYRRYLEHMGVVFDTAFSAPSTRSTGDIILK